MSDHFEPEHPGEPHQQDIGDTAERPAVRAEPQEARAGRRRAAPRRRSRLPGCLAVLVAIVLIAGLGYGGLKGFEKLKNHFAGAPDYSAGTAVGKVTFQVHSGDTATLIARNLKAAGVTESVDAFINVASSDPDASKIQVGFYPLEKHMSADEALKVLVDPKNMVQAGVVVREGARVSDIVKEITDRTDITQQQVDAALKDPAALGLPAEAGGNPEGYLFPATYTVTPGETAVQLLRQMVAKEAEVAQSIDLPAAAAKVNLTPEQVLTVASIIEYEASRDQDYPKVARAIYNRLQAGMPIQSDATVSYANGVTGQIWTTQAMRDNDSAYNTYQHKGLPPGPIGNPGLKTIEAALNPATGPWLYWVVVNLKTGETVFSTTTQ